jgi:DNA replication protein DnaC
MQNKNEVIKAMIELSSTVEEADKVIEEFADLHTYETKLQFLFDNFDVAIVDSFGSDDESKLHDDYVSVLSAIIHYGCR